VHRGVRNRLATGQFGGITAIVHGKIRNVACGQIEQVAVQQC